MWREGAVSLKACKACMHARYCSAACQRNHWPKHKTACKLRAAELRDEALFKDPPAKEECPICFLPMPVQLICCVSLPPATVSSVPIYNFAKANEELARMDTDGYYPCCGKSICKGCVHSFVQSGNDEKCPFCNAERKRNATDEENVGGILKRAEANDASAMNVLGSWYYHGIHDLHQDHAKAMALFTKSAELGCSKAHNNLASIYHHRGDLKKAKFHVEAAAMAEDEAARCNLGILECNSGNMERSIKHWTIAASAGEYNAMHQLRKFFKKGVVSRESIDATLAAYNNSCAEMRSEARDAIIRVMTRTV